MRNFSDYVQDRKKNALYHGAMRYALPDYFMSFTEATWNPRNGHAMPNGVSVYSIIETKSLWKDTDTGKQFLKAATPQDRLFIIKSKQKGGTYTKYHLGEDITTLEKICDFQPNKKLIKNMINAGLLEEADRERNKFKNMILEATQNCKTPGDMIWEATRWVAANGRNPDDFFPANAAQRWNNILRKLGFTAISRNEETIFLDVNEFEVIDEIRN